MALVVQNQHDMEIGKEKDESQIFEFKNCILHWYQNFDNEMKYPRRMIKATIRLIIKMNPIPNIGFHKLAYVYYKLMKANTFNQKNMIMSSNLKAFSELRAQHMPESVGTRVK